MKNSLKPLVRSLLLVLGLSPVATLSADEFSQTSSTRKGAGQPAAASVFNGTVVQNVHYAPQLNLGSFYGTGGNSYAEADVWLPLWQTSDQVAYADVRYQKEENTQWDIALGGGYRWLSEDMARLYDVYGFYNSYNSSYNNQFQQIMVGGSVRNEDWTLRGNYYYSIGPTRYTESSLDSLSFQSFGGISSIQNYGLLSYGFEENSINGGVIEIGRTVPAVAGLSLFGGYYGFASTSVNPFMNGFRARAEYVLDEAFNFSTPFLRHVTLESMVQYDNVNKGVFTIGARFDIPLGKSSTNSKLQAAMMDYVHFYPHAVQEDVTFTTPVIYQQNGQAVIFDIVNTLGQFDDAMGDGSDVVIINNDLQFDTTQTLGNNKYITGQNFEYAPGKFINLTGKDTLPTLTAPENSNLFILGQNNTVRDMNLVVSPKIKGAPFYYTLTTNTNNGTVGTLLVDNITTNGYVTINVGDTTTNSNISITKSTFTLETQGGDIINNGAINITSSNGSSVIVDSISGNTIIFKDIINGGRGIYLATAGSTSIQTINNVNNNTITFENSVTSFTVGIYFNNSGTQTIGSVDSNTVNIEANAINSPGIYFNNSGIQTIGSTTNNTVNFNGTATGSQGINFNTAAGGTLNAGNIQGNAITFNGATVNASGLDFNFDMSTKNHTIGLVEGNTINFNGAADVKSNGINFVILNTSSANADLAVTVAGITNNVVHFGANSAGANNVQAQAISLYNVVANSALTVNAFYGNNMTLGSTVVAPSAAIWLQTWTTGNSLIIINTNQPDGNNAPSSAGLTEANNGLAVNESGALNTITINGAAG